MKLNNTPLYVVRTIVCFVLFTVLFVSTAAQARYKRLHFTDPWTVCDGVFVEESMPQEQIDHLWEVYGELDSIYKYCFVTSFTIEYDNNHSFMSEFRSISPPENPQQVVSEEKYYLLSPDVVHFVTKLKSMYGNLSLLTYTAQYNGGDSSDSTNESFFVELVAGDTLINLGLLHEQRKVAASRNWDRRHQMRNILTGGCGVLTSVHKSELHTSAQPTLVVASGVTIPRGTDVGQPFAVVDVRGRTVYSGATTAGPSSTMIYLPAGVYVVLTPTTRQRVLVVP